MMPLLTPAQAGQVLGLPVAELEVLRARGAGPKCHAVGYGVVRYNTADVMRWRSAGAGPAS
jgi:hypothetical protein